MTSPASSTALSSANRTGVELGLSLASQYIEEALAHSNTGSVQGKALLHHIQNTVNALKSGTYIAPLARVIALYQFNFHLKSEGHIHKLTETVKVRLQEDAVKAGFDSYVLEVPDCLERFEAAYEEADTLLTSFERGEAVHGSALDIVRAMYAEWEAEGYYLGIH
jgi:hypothetical protein